MTNAIHDLLSTEWEGVQPIEDFPHLQFVPESSLTDAIQMSPTDRCKFIPRVGVSGRETVDSLKECGARTAVIHIPSNHVFAVAYLIPWRSAKGFYDITAEEILLSKIFTAQEHPVLFRATPGRLWRRIFGWDEDPNSPEHGEE